MTRKLLFLSLLAFLFCSSTLFSQDELPVNAYINQQGDTLTIKPYGASDLSYEIESLNNRIIEISEKFLIDVDITSINSDLEQTKILFNKEEQKIESIVGSQSNRQIDDYKKTWIIQRIKLKKQQNRISKRVDLCRLEIDELKLGLKRWIATKEENQKKYSYEEVQVRIDNVLKEIEETEKALNANLESLLLVQSNITDQLILIDQLLAKLENIRLEIQSQYFERDSKPIWNSMDTTFQFNLIKEKFSNNLIENQRFIIAFFQYNNNKIAIQVLVFVLSFLFFLFLRIQLNMLFIPLTEHEMNNARLISSKFVQASLLATFSSTNLIYINIPASVRELSIIGMIIMCVALLPGAKLKKFANYIWPIFILFLIYELQFFFENKSLIQRIFLLAETILTLILIYLRFYKNLKIGNFNENAWWRLTKKISPLFYLLLVSSIVANSFGYVALAILLTKITLTALFYAFVLSVFQMLLHSSVTILLHTRLANESKIILKSSQIIKTKLNSTIYILLIFLWIRSLLVSIGYFENIKNWVFEILNTNWEFRSMSISLMAILSFIMVIAITVLVTRTLKILLNEEFFPRIQSPRGIPGATIMLLSYFIGGIGFYIAISMTGIDLSKFGLIASALGVGIGFGLQNVVFNFIAGLILSFERPIQAGDTVEIGSLTGVVQKIGLRSSTIRTFEGSDVIVPNGEFISKEVINWTLSNQICRKEIKVEVAYGTHPEKVLEVLGKVAREHEEVLSYPLPLCLFDGFGSSALKFRILFWVPVDSNLSIQSRVGIAIYNELEKEGIEIPYQQHDVHIKSFKNLSDLQASPESNREKYEEPG